MAVVLHTTHGDLPVLLHFKECPKACFNFLALCASGYYDGCCFYRHIPGVLLQSGDPSNTGRGGESIFARQPAEVTSEVSNTTVQSRYFEDEGFGVTHHHSRGILSMAHKGVKMDTNASQFFITLSPQPTLNGVYTAFGVVDLEGAFNTDTCSIDEGRPMVRTGAEVLESLEAAAAVVDAKFIINQKAELRISHVTVLYNPFAEGRMRC